jgi:hypothetical protein
MVMTHRKTGWLWGIALALGLAPPPAARGTDDDAALRLTAFAVDVAAPRARTGTLEIVIERWTTDQERDRLRGTLMEKGSSALLTALRYVRPRAGYIRGRASLGWDVHFARELPLPEGGRRIIIATDRPMSFWELWRRPRSADYEFTLAEIRLGPDGKGEGKLVTAAKVTWNEAARTVEVENYTFEPVRLNEVRVSGGR